MPPPLILHARVVGNQGGGPDKTIFNSARYAPPRYRMAAAVIHPADNPQLDRLERLASDNACPLHPIPERHALSLATFRHALDLCRGLGVAIWHAHDYKSNLLGLAVARSHPLRLVTTVHGWMPVTRRLRAYEALDRRLLRFYHHVFAVSPPLHATCRRVGVRPDRLTALPNGIETRDRPAAPSRADARARLGHRAGPLHLACVGRLSDEKRLDRAIRLIARLRDLDRDAHLHLVGDGPERTELTRLAQRLNVPDRIVFHGWQHDVTPHLAAADLVLLTSRTEGLPNALLEAMHAGVPVAATPVGGVPDLLDQGRCGVLLDPDTQDAWPAAVLAAIDDASSRDRRIEAAGQRIADRFTFARRMATVLDTYDRLLAPGQAARRAA
jgi:glycosyltransferase involved in cell wall biosynthesis